jgi:predicted glutamine amidotransferase
MCRLFAGLSAKAESFSDHLVDDGCSLLFQANARKDKPQADGWGIASVSKSTKVFKSVGWATEEGNAFSAVVRGLDSRAALGHLRRASNPLKLPRSRIIAPENIQPFVHGGLAFAHNGQVNDPLSAKDSLGKWKKFVRGENDSEVYFWHFIRALDETGEVAAALRLTEERLADANTKRAGPFTSLNVVIARKGEIFGWCRYVKQPKTVPTSLQGGKQGYYTMCYLPGKSRFAIMSEPSRKCAWVQMENGELVSARLGGKKIEWETERLL